MADYREISQEYAQGAIKSVHSHKRCAAAAWPPHSRTKLRTPAAVELLDRRFSPGKGDQKRL